MKNIPLSEDDIAFQKVVRKFELSLFLKSKKVLKKMEKMLGAVSSVKFELQKMKLNSMKIT